MFFDCPELDLLQPDPDPDPDPDPVVESTPPTPSKFILPEVNPILEFPAVMHIYSAYLFCNAWFGVMLRMGSCNWRTWMDYCSVTLRNVYLWSLRQAENVPWQWKTHPPDKCATSKSRKRAERRRRLGKPKRRSHKKNLLLAAFSLLNMHAHGDLSLKSEIADRKYLRKFRGYYGELQTEKLTPSARDRLRGNLAHQPNAFIATAGADRTERAVWDTGATFPAANKDPYSNLVLFVSYLFTRL
ncbi:expressed unknown protein [Seminavis robusta]|uniref:Uncharacterized protein n=1 Tax=Seminavis robusta TaxID=568900 RepID=A0A9N8I067_9STRA|nr:expressed unknown protein [Seminavis robusta]|eukprot:Sro3484_g348510.1 n/a (243) ;mRNA; r:4312-5040